MRAPRGRPLRCRRVRTGRGLRGAAALAAFVANEIGLGRDRSAGEIVNYGLAFMSAALFFLAFVELRSRMFLFAALLMAFIWFDDSAQYHERVGAALVSKHDLPALFGTRPQDFGEFLAWGFAGAILAVSLLLALARRGPGDLGALALLSLCFGLLVLFGMVADFAHVAASPDLDLLLLVVEDGGEMVAIALISGISLGLARNGEAYRSACARRVPAPQAEVVARAADRPAQAEAQALRARRR